LLQISLFARGRSDGRMPKPPFVFRYRVRNWRAYNHALINRGRLIVWFDEHTVTAWRNTEPAAGPGAPRLYADLAIECVLVFMSPTAHERAMKLCSSVGPRPPSCRGARRNRIPPRILSVGGLRAITSSCRSRNRDAPRGGSSFSGCTRQNIAENTMFRFNEVVRRATLGAEPRYATHRSAGEMRRPQSHDAVGDAPNGARVMIRDLPRVNCS